MFALTLLSEWMGGQSRVASWMWWLSCQALKTWMDVDESRKEKGKVTISSLSPLPGATRSSYGEAP